MSDDLRCAVFIATSLDGFIARRDGSLDWLATVQQPGEDYGYRTFFDSIDTLIFGRGTYETALGFDAWPYTGKRCAVLTHAARASVHGETFHAGELAPLVDRLSAEGARRAYVDGGKVIRQFLEARLLHELTLSIVPVLLGDGIPLFGEGAGAHGLRLVESRSFPSGLVQVTYRVDGATGR